MRLMLLPLALAVGCSRSEPPPTPSVPLPSEPPATVKVAPTAPVMPVAPQDPIAAMNQATLQMGMKPLAAVVNWRELVALLPDGAGDWKAAAPATGESTAMGAMQVSSGRRRYQRGGASATLTITDASGMAAMVMPFNLARQMRHDGSDGYANPVEVAGQPAIEEWKRGNRAAKATVLVAGRFLVVAEANDQPDAKALLDLVGKVDLGKLAALK